ncbi:uncharacterized protein LOC142983538 [Anticarsia gemmatalis]|uniref:uncharacterized protein LOC142983538 n=1 Tax=Anticarsia gemmatalis TaxID=129554 RepID=UPI003F759DC3
MILRVQLLVIILAALTTLPELCKTQTTTKTTVKARSTRKIPKTDPEFVSVHNICEYLLVPCMNSQNTGRLCAKTVYHTYQEFVNYCNMEYANCMEHYEIYEIAFMGGCYVLPEIHQYMHYNYIDDFHLDQYYVVNDW